MNKKVLKTMIALVCVFLCALYVLKMFFPEQFMMTIQNENLVNIGTFISSRWWLREICAIITSFITYWLYLGAVTQKWRLSWKGILVVLLAIAINHGLYELDATLASGFSIIAMLIIPAIFKAKLTRVAIVFSTHYMSQLLSTLIRGLPLYLTSVNYITLFLMGLESYFWLLLFYLYFNLKKENKANEI